MKKKHFRISVLLITVFCGTLVSCPLLWPNMSKDDMWIRGRILIGYPEWLYISEHDMLCGGVTDWLDWQSEEGKKLHNLVPDTVIGDDFTGKFRLVLAEQDTSIVFNDVYRTCYILFYNWIHKVNSTTTGHSFPQENSEVKYEYPCHVKTNLREDETDSNKGLATLTRQSATNELPNRFNYKLIINGKVVVDCDLYNQFEIKTFDNVPNWLPKNVASFRYKKDVGYEIHFYDLLMQLDTDNLRRGGLFSCEGISLKEVDDMNKTISFWLEDRDKGGFADYVTIKVHDDMSYADISFYKDGVTDAICTDYNVKCFYE